MLVAKLIIMVLRQLDKTGKIHGGERLLCFICAGLVAVYIFLIFRTGVEIEQQEHAGQLTMQVRLIKNQFEEIEKRLQNLNRPSKDKQQLDNKLDNKKEVIDRLRTLEEQGNLLNFAYQEYQRDTSLQYASVIIPSAVLDLHERHIKTQGLKTAIDRYVRGTEQTFFQTGLTREQTELVREYYWALQWHLDNFDK